MARPAAEIITAIETFNPSNGNWRGLDELLEELFQSGEASLGIDAMLGVFERHPTDDGAGVFWGIVHGLESLPGYESSLVTSLRKAPSDFALLMVNRLLNAGREEVGGVRLGPLLEQLAQDLNAHPDIRREAQAILDSRKA